MEENTKEFKKKKELITDIMHVCAAGDCASLDMVFMNLMGCSVPELKKVANTLNIKT